MGSNSQSQYSSRAGASNHSRSRASSSRHEREPDRHHNLKTSIQVIGLLVCLRVLLPKMFPTEQEREASPPPRNGYQGQQGYGYTDNVRPPPPYSRAQLREASETREVRRIEPAYPPGTVATRSDGNADRNRDRNGERDRNRIRDRDADGSSWDGTAVYDSDDGSESENERERRERRRERRKERDRERDRGHRRNSGR